MSGTNLVWTLSRFSACGPRLCNMAARKSPIISCAGVDIGAIKRGHASIVKGREIPGHPVALDRAMPTGQLPAAANDPRDDIARLDFTSFRQRHGAGVRTAVTSSW